MISRGFIKSSLTYTVAGALPMASALILLPFYLAYLPKETYGALAICLAISVLIQVIVTYSFDTSLYIHFHELKNDKRALSGFVSAVFLFMLLVAAAVVVLGAIAGGVIFKAVYPDSTISFYPWGFMATATGALQAIFKVHGNLLQTREKPSPFLWSNVISFSLIALLTLYGLQKYPGSLIGPIGSRLVAAGVTSSWALFRVFREFGFHFQSPWQNTAFSFNAYTFVYQLQQWAMNHLDKFIILMFMPLSAVGIYDFALKCVVGVELLLNGLNSSIHPKIIKLITAQSNKTSTPEINRYFYGQTATIIIVICLTILAIPIAWNMFITKSEYSEALYYIPFVALIYVFKAMRLYFVIPFTVLKRMRELTVLNFFVAALKIALMFWLVAEYKILGIVWSAYLAYVFELVLLRTVLTRYYRIGFNYMKLLILPLAMFVVIIVSEYYLTGVSQLYRHICYLLLCSSLVLFAYRRELNMINPSTFFK